MTVTIEFFWDAVSPYSYLAGTQIEALAARNEARLVWRPFLLGGVMQATGNRPPLTVPAKFSHMLTDLQRWAAYYGVPLRKPDNFPASTLHVQRIACALPEAEVGRWARATAGAYWGRGEDISQPETIRSIASSLDLDADALLAAAQAETIKARLKANTDEAVQRGAFGAPTFFIGEAMFWGNDRLPLLERALTPHR